MQPREDDPAESPSDAAPAPTPRRSRGVVLRLFLLTVLCAVLGVAWLAVDMRRVLREPMPLGSQPIRFEVPRGASLNQIARSMQSNGLVPVPEYVIAYARWSGAANSLKAGEYRVDPGMTPVDLLERLVSGEVVLHSLTLVEGWTFRQLKAALAEHPALDRRLEGLDDEAIMREIGFEGVHPEGRFLAETYHFPAGTTDVDFLKRAYRDMQALLEREWAARSEGLPLESPDDALVLASIIEKETAVAEERPRIAGVFVRRLRKRMRLETDPTVIYGLGESFDGNLRRADLRRDTPYNTYVHRGLPPTPIAMPGQAAIHAALHPADGDSLFFVARGDGTHQFSRTYEQHRKAVQRYQIDRRRRRKPDSG